MYEKKEKLKKGWRGFSHKQPPDRILFKISHVMT